MSPAHMQVFDPHELLLFQHLSCDIHISTLNCLRGSVVKHVHD